MTISILIGIWKAKSGKVQKLSIVSIPHRKSEAKKLNTNKMWKRFQFLIVVWKLCKCSWQIPTAVSIPHRCLKHAILVGLACNFPPGSIPHM
jgi:hypothetical protein